MKIWLSCGHSIDDYKGHNGRRLFGKFLIVTCPTCPAPNIAIIEKIGNSEAEQATHTQRLAK